jgi:hypothetical protein
MTGPKLDARTYAILILAVIGITVSVKLVAQQSNPTSVSSTADVAAATREVAAATNRVADSNAQIAQALTELAQAVRGVQDAMDRQDQVTTTPAAEETEEGYRNLRQSEPLPAGETLDQEDGELGQEEENQGVFEMRSN